jgi:Tol biopolymer transport system component
MGLYQSLSFQPAWFIQKTRNIVLLAILLLASCAPPAATQAVVKIELAADGETQSLSLTPGATVQEALEAAGVTLEYLDRVEPAPFTLLTDGGQVRVIRIKEDFSVEQEVIPFERTVVQTESLPSEQTMLSQSGANGLREITYRHVYEDGVEVSKFPVRETIVNEAIPEIIMVGIQTPFAPVEIPGRIVYLLGSNAWMMDQTTGNRRPAVTTGDLDGHIFTLSKDGSRLLFTRRSTEEGQINSLWVADLNTDPIELYDLQVPNVIHFADWAPDPKNDQVAFSTVEPRDTAPGWQANNDFNVLSFSPSGWVSQWKVYVDPNSGGLYGWWGTNYGYDPTGEQLAYARADSIGLVDLEEGALIPLINITPVQTGGDWAWVPGFSWSPDGGNIVFVDHSPSPGSDQPEESVSFDLSTILIDRGTALRMVPNTGMFAYPKTSPQQTFQSGESGYQIAFLQSLNPGQSETSRYRLVVMDRDGSNQQALFPQEGEPGLEPQQPAWSPTSLPDKGRHWIAVSYEGNLWLVDAQGLEEPQQITGDGLVSRYDWK